jgi:uncharacterized membrane protein HdeD (DUF308 family)
MKRLDWTQLTWRRGAGAAIFAMGVAMLFAPLVVGEWIIALLGLLLVAAGLFHFVETLRIADNTTSYFEFFAGVVAVAFGLLLFFSPSTVLSGTLIAAALFFLIDGGVKLYGVRMQEGSPRWWSLVNGLFSLALALLIWYFITANLGLYAVGLALGLKLIFEGWTLVFAPERGWQDDEEPRKLDEHPDWRLGLEPNDTIKGFNEVILRTDPTVTGQNIYWSLTILGILFAIHFVRTDARWSFIELISPFTAVIGDAIVALFVGIMIVLPARMIWRRLTRPVERAAWWRIRDLDVHDEDPTPFERLLRLWVVNRMRFSHELLTMRYSLNYTFWRLLRFGLPATAVLVAVNTIWGFSWYFNSENWASAVYQEITKGRVDTWRKHMADDAEAAAIAAGVPADKVFAIEAKDVNDAEDFSFLVIGDTGEGDPSQAVLRDQLINAGNRPEVKFLVLSSDVIYPDGKMKDYERNFYLPFKGFAKPIYAIPGNHDWFDANEGFNANFLDPDSAKLALRARLAEDVGTDLISADWKFDDIIAEAKRLREYYRVDNGHQRAPFFEMHTNGFSLIAADTGILRRFDEKQKAWFEAALQRAGGNFKMVVLGHPFYVSGRPTFEGDAEFQSIYDTMRRYGVQVAMAGDTHDFEFYRRRYGDRQEMLHFVNGGGGAYLSIGTAVGFPKDPATPDWAFYPREDAVTAKIQKESPWWKLPFLVWMQQLRGWPFDQEMVSGAFDFNSAPFFQSFMEVRVERSQNRVRFLLHGVNGPLRWQDVQAGGEVIPEGRGKEDVVEFIAPFPEIPGGEPK